MKSESIVNILIENINTDQGLLEKVQEQIETSKEEKREITGRLKDYRKDVETLLKYADEQQRKKFSELGFDFSQAENGLNPVAKLAFDIILKAKDNALTNEQLYNEYAKTFKNKKDAFNYTEFNIKCRTLFNTQRLLRKVGKNDSSSRDNIISLNGRVLPKENTDETKKNDE